MANQRLDSAKTLTHQRTPLDDSQPPTSGAKHCKSGHQVRGWKGSSSKCLAYKDLVLNMVMKVTLSVLLGGQGTEKKWGAMRGGR